MRQRRIQLAAAVAVVAIASVVATTAVAGNGKNAKAKLTSFEEVPAVSTNGSGEFKAKVRSNEIEYTLSYEDLSAAPAQAHIHFGQRSVNGGISAFLCGGDSKPPCPPAPATVTGTIEPQDVIGPESQGIAPGEFDELVRAMRAGVTYANVHTTNFPGGEIRGQIKAGGDD
jgi:hypothetical protein